MSVASESNINHRYSVRLPLGVPVEVFKRGQFLGRYIIRDMDVEGVFIEMPTTDLQPAEVLELVFVATDWERCDCTLLAGVVRLEADGAGMMLFDHEHKALSIMRASDPSEHLPSRRASARPGSTNTNGYGNAV